MCVCVCVCLYIEFQGLIISMHIHVHVHTSFLLNMASLSFGGGTLSLEADDITVVERVLSPHRSRVLDTVLSFEGVFSLQ